MKYAAQQLADFIAAPWDFKGKKNSWYFDDVDTSGLLDENLEPIDPNKTFTISKGAGGVILWQGKGDDPTAGEGLDFWSEFRKFVATQTHERILVEIPKGSLPKLRALLKGIKGRVV